MTAFLAVLALAGGVLDPELLRPDTVLRPPDGPTIAFVEAPGSLAAAIRITVPFVESRSDAGAGYLIQLLAMRRTRRLQEMVGAAVRASRTAHGLVYHVSGAVADFDHLAGVARELLARPESSGFVAARARLDEMNREERETPRGALHLQLRSRMTPPVPSPAGPRGSLGALTHARVTHLWAASHRRRELSLVVVGAIPPEVVLSAFAALGEVGVPPVTLPPGADSRGSVPSRPERIRVWYGEAFPAGDPRDPRSALLMHLASQHLTGLDGEFDLHLERWEFAARSWLVVTGAAFSRSARAMRALIRDYRSDMQASLSPGPVQHARAALRATLLGEARSPEGLAELIGRHLDATGDADAAARYLERLEGVDYEAMADFMDDISAGEAVTAQVAG